MPKMTAILASVAVQIVALVSLGLLNSNLLALAIQVVWPIWLTLEAVYTWSNIPACRAVAAITNLLYGALFGLGVLLVGAVLMRQTSWLIFGQYQSTISMESIWVCGCSSEPRNVTV